MNHALSCPQCGAPLTPHKFAKAIVCPHCGTTVQLDESTVSSKKFKQAFQAWNSPASYQISSLVSIGDQHWDLQTQLAYGEISDVYRARRARWPTELAVLKILRNSADRKAFDNEWEVLKGLANSEAPGAETFRTLLPQPIIHGDSTAGPHTGKRISVFRWASGFRYTLAEVRQAYNNGIPPRASIWIWRRILEILSFIHASGYIHGAILPSHLLVQENEHGVRLVGYGSAGHKGEKLERVSPRFGEFYPETNNKQSLLTTELDLIMSARCVVALLGGDAKTASLPAEVPEKLTAIIQRIALQSNGSYKDAWSIREELGEIANSVFGTPQFTPIVMPS